VLSIGVLGSATCAATRIDRILADPSHYRDRQVRVSGSVVDSYSFANRGAYRLGDESGHLDRVRQRAPRTGARVTVEGTIREGFNLGALGDRMNLPAGLGPPSARLRAGRRAPGSVRRLRAHFVRAEYVLSLLCMGHHP